MGSFTSDVASVGPMDIDAAGELAPKVTKQNEAHELIQHVRNSHPIELTMLQQRDEDRPRTAALDADEVFYAAQDAFGDEDAKGGVVKVLSSKVRGKSQPVEEKAVIVLFETPSGRTARGAIGYGTLEESVRTFDRKVDAGEITDVDETDAKDLTRTVERQEDRIRRLGKELAEANERAEAAAGGDDTPPADDAGAGDGDGDQPPAPPEVVVPDGVTPGEDPAWPVDDAGEPIYLPDAVREQLAADAAKQAELESELAEAKQAADNQPEQAAAPEPEQVDLSTVELPEGNSDTIVAGMSYYSDNVVAALAEFGKAKGTREAAAAEHERRTAAATSTEG